MNELRRDYLLDRWVIIAKERAKRPKDFVVEEKRIHRARCPFCPGQIDMPVLLTLPEKAVRWKVAVIPNKYPATGIYFPARLEVKGLLTWSGAAGFHEIVIETPDHEKDLWELPLEHVTMYIRALQMRQAVHLANKSMVYTAIFKNRGVAAGESISHAHTQIITTTKVPSTIVQEVIAYKRLKSKEGCVFEKIVEEERNSKRFIYENQNFFVLAPFASITPGEVWIIAKRHFRDILELDPPAVRDLADALIKSLKGLNSLFPGVSYNLAFHQAPKGEDFHFHIEIYPRLTTFAGLELGFGLYINVLPPEEFAQNMREVLE